MGSQETTMNQTGSDGVYNWRVFVKYEDGEQIASLILKQWFVVGSKS